jgi:imidazolonepropionase
MALIVTGIRELVTNEPGYGESPLGLVSDAAFVVEDSRIAWVGPASAAPLADELVDVGGRGVVPGFVDSHAHLVFAGDRAAEFAARMTGQRYTAGGIRTTGGAGWPISGTAGGGVQSAQ